jgi:hypothetical protein
MREEKGGIGSRLTQNEDPKTRDDQPRHRRRFVLDSPTSQRIKSRRIVVHESDRWQDLIQHEQRRHRQEEDMTRDVVTSRPVRLQVLPLFRQRAPPLDIRKERGKGLWSDGRSVGAESRGNRNERQPSSSPRLLDKLSVADPSAVGKGGADPFGDGEGALAAGPDHGALEEAGADHPDSEEDPEGRGGEVFGEAAAGSLVAGETSCFRRGGGGGRGGLGGVGRRGEEGCEGEVWGGEEVGEDDEGGPEPGLLGEAKGRIKSWSKRVRSTVSSGNRADAREKRARTRRATDYWLKTLCFWAKYEFD